MQFNSSGISRRSRTQTRDVGLKTGGLITVCGGATRPHNNPPPPTVCKGLRGSLDPNQPCSSSSSEVSSGGLTPKMAHPHGGDWGPPLPLSESALTRHPAVHSAPSIQEAPENTSAPGASLGGRCCWHLDT